MTFSSAKKIADTRVRFGGEIRERLEHHARRLHLDMTNIIREATFRYLKELDREELIAIEAKQRSERRGRLPAVPRDFDHPWGAAPGLGFRAKVPETKVPEKIERSFRRFAEYIEASRDKIERDMRAQTVIDEIKSRVDKPEEVDAACVAFSELLRERAKSVGKAGAPRVAVPAAIVEGDVD
jgi:hypothetical protein